VNILTTCRACGSALKLALVLGRIVIVISVMFALVLQVIFYFLPKERTGATDARQKARRSAIIGMLVTKPVLINSKRCWREK
jgi:phosphotransferase system  glucose/maltose/N-acetylglucosamine-specific IIC component